MSGFSGPNLFLICRDPATRDPMLALLENMRDQFENLKIVSKETTTIDSTIAIAQTVVYDTGIWSPNDDKAIASIRSAGYSGPVLVLALPNPLKGSFPEIKPTDKITFFGRPFNEKDLLGVLRRILMAPIVAARRYPRHETNEDAQFQIEGQTMIFPCRMKNMSKGGAFVEFGRRIHVRIGDDVTLRVRLGRIKREYALRGRVAWIPQRGTGIGIEFVNALGSLE